jgi:ADP-ribosylation factor GTPase-activating protein 1
MQALSKGWGILSSVVTATSRKVYETATDPAVHEQIKGYADTASKTAMSAAGTANDWSKRQLGVDVADHVGAVVDKVKDVTGLGAGGPGGGYESVGRYGGYGGYDDDQGTRLYADDGDDFFEVHTEAHPAPHTAPHTAPPLSSSSAGARNASTTVKKTENWEEDEWKDF